MEERQIYYKAWKGILLLWKDIGVLDIPAARGATVRHVTVPSAAAAAAAKIVLWG
jgi:hypothetical protein